MPLSSSYLLGEGSLGGLGFELCQLGHGSINSVHSARTHCVVESVSQMLEECLTPRLPYAPVDSFILSRGPGSFTSTRALLAFFYGLEASLLSPTDLTNPQNKGYFKASQKRRWLGVSSLSMILLSCLNGGLASHQRVGVYLVQGHNKGFFAWCEPQETSRISTTSPQLDILDLDGLRLITTSAYLTDISDAPMVSGYTHKPQHKTQHKIQIDSLLWIDHSAMNSSVQDAKKNAQKKSIQAKIPAGITTDSIAENSPYIELFCQTDELSVTRLSLAESITQSLAGMRALALTYAAHVPWHFQPPEAVYLRAHYGHMRSSP